MSSRWRERKGTFVSAGELQARRKALLVPVQKYRQAWVQVSPNSTYKVLKWVPRPTGPPRPSASAAESDQPPPPSFINDPNTIDDSSDEDEDMDDDEEGGSERMDDRSVAPVSPTGSFKLSRKKSRAVAATEDAGGQLAGLETGEIAEQIEVDEDEDEDDDDDDEERRSTSHPQGPLRLNAPSGSEPSPLPPPVQLDEEVPGTELDVNGESYDDVGEEREGDRLNANGEDADVTMQEGEVLEPSAQWTTTAPPPPPPPPPAAAASAQDPLPTDPLPVYVMPNLPSAITDVSPTPFAATEVERLENLPTSEPSASTDDVHQPGPDPEASQSAQFSAPMEVEDLPPTTEPAWQPSQSGQSEIPRSNSSLDVQPIDDELVTNDSRPNLVPTLLESVSILPESALESSIPPNASTDVPGVPSFLPPSTSTVDEREANEAPNESL
ncbi:hypothetical protein CROQUDRAFT_656359 [Cronartium quercuum f. sp. fusiforme G11]|uniref:Uncharacterized protein n=1 Tax=Cronartium quercuum f. sp. fusiforme G11 TaxID=708437 RepID=A0A9P6NHU4_9BASI|nr:hypothetical protein CROQUDRAFT_656359 [Cronartium quercuum f. sp. fusiforme G11]